MTVSENIQNGLYDYNESELFFKDAFEELGLSELHPYADEVKRLAWQEGHSLGYNQVFYYLQEFSVFLKELSSPRNIEVKYIYGMHTKCAGQLKISLNGKTIYDDSCVCRSTGSCNYKKNRVQEGKLIWKESSKFPQDIQNAVQLELDKVKVCCGGCM